MFFVENSVILVSGHCSESGSGYFAHLFCVKSILTSFEPVKITHESVHNFYYSEINSLYICVNNIMFEINLQMDEK